MADDLDAAPVAAGALREAIPVIDLQAPRPVVVSSVTRACAEWGFFQLIGHGVSERVIACASAEAAAFFAAPKAQKRALSRSRDNPWGFYDRELTKTARDKKEIFDIGPPPAPNDPFSGATPWPVWQSQFEPAMREYFAACEGVSAALVDVIAEGLGAPPEALAHSFAPHATSFLRLNYYPVDDPLLGEAEDKADLGIHHHTDAGALTVLLQDEVAGLQVYRAGAWHTVTPLAGAFVINIGDMMQVWSNDLCPAPVHRVLAMEKAERRSLPFFYNPSYEAVVAPLPGTLSAARPARYRPIPWGEFRRRRADGDFANYGQEVQIADYRRL